MSQNTTERTSDAMYQSLPKEEVIAAIERKNPSRVPLILTKFWGQGLREQYGQQLSQFDKYPEDAILLLSSSIDPDKMALPWLPDETKTWSIDERVVLADWKYLDDFIALMPKGDEPGLLDSSHEQAQETHEQNRYFLHGFWKLFFEKPWEIRGMSNIMIDYYDHPDEVHKLNEALCNLYVTLIKRASQELKPDGFWSSDDLGSQRQLMMRPDQFREFIKPYYCRIAQACHEENMHFWLHSCGNNTDIMEDLIDTGLDVLHPIQKHAMNEKQIVRQYGERMTFLAGMDVQKTLVFGKPEDVRAEVRYLIDTFDRPDGGMCLAAGNGIVEGTPLENIEAFLDEACHYGREHRRQFQKV